MAVVAFAVTSCMDEEIEPQMAFSSNGAPVFDGSIEFQRPRNVSYVEKGDFYVATAWSKTLKSQVALYSKDGSTNWIALNPERNTGLSAFLINNEYDFVGVVDLFEGMGSQGVAVVYKDGDDLMAKRFFRVEPSSEILKFKSNTKEDRPMRIAPDGDIQIETYIVSGITHKTGKDNKCFEIGFVHGRKEVYYKRGTDAGAPYNMLRQPVRFGNRIAGILNNNGGFESFVSSGSNAKPNVLTTGNGNTFDLYTHWGEFLATKKNAAAKFKQNVIEGCGEECAETGTILKSTGMSNSGSFARTVATPGTDIFRLDNGTKDDVVFKVYSRNNILFEVAVEKETRVFVKGVANAVVTKVEVLKNGTIVKTFGGTSTFGSKEVCSL